MSFASDTMDISPSPSRVQMNAPTPGAPSLTSSASQWHTQHIDNSPSPAPTAMFAPTPISGRGSLSPMPEHSNDLARLYAATDHTHLMLQEVQEHMSDMHDPRAELFARSEDPYFRPRPTGNHWHMRLSLSQPPINRNIGWTVATADLVSNQTELVLPHWRPSDVDLVEGRTRLGVAINLTPISGLLTLTLLDPRSVVYYTCRGVQPVNPGETVVLTERLTWIQIGDFAFNLVYSIPQASLKEFLVDRERYLDAHWPGVRKYYPAIVKELYPHKLESNLGPDFTVFKSFASGGFGEVYVAVRHGSGELKAIKRGEIRRDKEREAWNSEILLNREFQGREGLLCFETAWCKDGEDPLSCDAEEDHITAVMPYAIGSFADWDLFFDLEPLDQLDLFLQTLEGLGVLHNAGVMHRDLTETNMVVVCLEPAPKAAIIDFGKAIRAESSEDTCLAARHKVAPEVARLARSNKWREEIHPDEDPEYTNAIDIWSWAYSVAKVLGLEPPNGRPYLSPRDYKSLREEVMQARSGAFWKPLQTLLADMLAYHPAGRPTVKAALRHKCWLPVIERRLETLPDEGSGSD